MIQLALIFGITLVFFVFERILPGRELPETPGWYARALFLNLCQFGIVMLAGVSWNKRLQNWSVFHMPQSVSPILTGLLAWFIGTFVFYWWHRARHRVNFLWRVCHQIHHSPARIEVLTAFYKHPIEIAANSVIASTIVYSLLGGSAVAGAWLSHEFAHTPLVWLFHSTSGASLHSPSTRCSRFQLWRHHLVGSPLRHI
jgi:sterol desaturase/sphingolipid hydroxylase (fatty acid hydroxylase superfamily)